MNCPHLYTRFHDFTRDYVYCAMCGDETFGRSLTLEERKRVPSINERTDGPDIHGWYQYEQELRDFWRFPA